MKKMCNCEQNNSRLLSIGDSMGGIARSYEEEANTKFMADKDIEYHSEQMKDFENFMRGVINAEKTEDGKPKFSNQEQRDLATYNVLKEHAAYQEHKKLKEEAINTSKEAGLKLDILKVRLKVLESHLKIQELWR